MTTIMCPSCGNGTSFNPVWCTVRGILEEHRTEDRVEYGKVTVRLIEPYTYGDINYGILVCQVCGERIVVENGQYCQEDDWRVVYPIHHKVASEEIPQPIKDEFEEASLCFAIRAYRACASMCQRALESLCHNRKVSGLNQLQEDGIISSTLFERATEIRLWAGIIKHKPIAESVSKEDAEQLLTYLELILNAAYVEPKKFENLKQKREQIEKGAG